MKIDFARFCRDRQIPVAPSGHVHHRAGWIGIVCPFCDGNPGYHMGLNLEKNFFTCYRCGWHPGWEVLSAMTGLKGDALDDALAPYLISGREGEQTERPIDRPILLSLPDGCGPMGDRHREYLVSRLFDPDRLERIWELQGTGHLGDYRFRIVAPIRFQGQVVSYQGRDVTGKQKERYKGCRSEDEVIPHKQILYGWDEARGESCLVVEGITGVWRCGPGTLATFGANYSPSQVRMITSQFRRAFILFDPDEAGKKNGVKLADDLGGMGIETEILEVPEGYDSGSLPQDVADRLAAELGIRR